MRNMDRIKSKPIIKSFRRGFRKPSIKITVSADVPELYNSSPVKTPSPQAIVKRRVMTFGPGPDGIQYDDENDETFTRITVDDSVVDFPNCIDFGIKDFLCCKDEIDLELSSDTDTSYLEAKPPHRFSDSELESQIEIMSITLENVLNLYPKRSSFAKDDTFTFDLLRLENHAERTIADIDEDDTTRPRRFEDENSRLLRLGRNAELRNLNITSGNNNRTGRLPPPPRPFRRHISLPASIFMTYLMAEKSFNNKDKRSSLNNNERSNNDLLMQNERFFSRKLTKIDGSYSSNESTEAEEISPNYEEGRNNEDLMDHGGDSSSMASESGDSRRGGGSDTPISLQNADLGAIILSSVASESVDELDRVDDDDDDDDQTQQAFTSEIEKKSLILRYMRKLIRQDTSGNFAPPDYCI